MLRRPHARVASLAVPALAAALAAGAYPALAAAQELSGLALGPEGEPLQEVPVVLHRVGGDGGAFVATDTTTPDGHFRFPLEEGDSAVYFVALRYEDRMYLGPAVQAESYLGSGYLVRVEPGSEAGAVASALGGQAAASPTTRPTGRTEPVSSDTGAFVLVGLLTLSAVAAFVLAAPRYRDRRTKDALIDLATVENALADLESPEDRNHLLATRDRLRKQLGPGG